jgi:Ca2+-binding EF-hand superfamily protein
MTNSAVVLAGEMGSQEPQAICDICYSYVMRLQAFVEAERLQWSHLSPRGKQWLINSGIWEQINSGENSVETYLCLQPDPEDLEAIQKDVGNGRTDICLFDWEMQELLLRINPTNYRENIQKLLSAFCARNRAVGYCQGMNNVAAWLLAFMDLNSAFWMFCHVVERLLIPGFYNGAKTSNSLNGFYIEATVIASLMFHFVPGAKTLTMPVNDFVDFFAIKLLIQLYVNAVDLESMVYLWDKFTAEGSIALVRGVVSLLFICERLVKKQEHPATILKFLAANRVAAQLPFIYDKMFSEITPTRVTRLRKQARDYRAKQWKNCGRLTLKKLETASKFSQEEIKVFQNEFNRVLSKKRKTKGKKKPEIKRQQTVMILEEIKTEIHDQEGEVDIGITKEEFLGIIGNLKASLVDYAGGIFDMFDEDKSGYLDFRELLICLSVLSKGTFEEKLRVCFDLFDTDNSGYLQIIELKKLLAATLKPYYQNLSGSNAEVVRETSDTVTNKLIAMAEAQQNVLSFQDLYSCILADPLLLQAFSQHVGESGVDDHYEQLDLATAIFSGSLLSETPEVPSETRCGQCALL